MPGSGLDGLDEDGRDPFRSVETRNGSSGLIRLGLARNRPVCRDTAGFGLAWYGSRGLVS
jgi:hypothetical protein